MCRSRKEQVARDDLRRRAYEVFWPYVSEWVGTGHKAKSRLVKRSWLSRYLFVRTSLEHLYGVNNALGVSTVVYAAGQEPFPISDQVIKELQDKTDHLGEIYVSRAQRKRSNFKEGDVIRFTDEKSPLFGLYAEAIKVLDNGTVHALFKGQLVGSQKIILSEPIGEVVPGVA